MRTTPNFRSNRRPLLAEQLEPRQMLSAALGVSAPLMVFNAVTAQTSQVETLTLTNTGDAALALSGLSVVADPSQTTDASARFAVTNAGSLPATLAPGATFNLTLDYVPTAVGLDYALLDIASSDPATPTAVVQLRGIGTDGVGGVHQPSLMRILRAYGLPNYNRVGETDETSAYYPEPPAANSTEVDLQQMVKAGPGDVSFTILASFVGDAATPIRIGWYQPSDLANTKVELFHTVQSDYQSVYVQPVGNTSFDPGTGAFGLYNPSQTVRGTNGSLLTAYTQDALNTDDTTDPRKFRFFPYINAAGVAVPNAYIMTSTEWPAPVGYDFTNIVAIISNVKPAAPVAAADAATARAGAAASVNVLSNDTATTGTLTPSSVTITTAPASGGTVTVDPTTGQATYTAPAGFHGTDTFAYTVANSAGYTSAPATVTVTVSAGAGGIVTAPVATTAIAGVATTVNVLAVDSDSAGTLVPTTVTIVSAPSAGGTATVNADGTIAYAPAAGFAGTETFSYTVGDSAGAMSNPTAVTVTVASPTAAPVAGTVNATTVVNSAITIDVKPSVATTVGLDLSTLALAEQPTDGGTATVNADGTITYTPASNFVGTANLAYTVHDANGRASGVGAIVVQIGVNVGSAAGDYRSFASTTTPFFAELGVTTTITLNRGTAEIFLTGSGNLLVDKAGRASTSVIGGVGQTINSIALRDTTAASVLMVTAPKNAAGGFPSVRNITDSDPLGRIIAPTAALYGVNRLSSVIAIQMGGVTDATLTIGSGIAAVASLSLGSVTDSSLSAAVPMKLLKASAWTNAGHAAITAPSIGTLTVTGAFAPTLTLTAGGTSLKSATITGPLAATSPWSIAGAIGTLTVRGSLTSTITAASANTIHVTGAITNTSITTTGNVGTISAGSLSGDTFLIGASAGTTVATATLASLGAATLKSLRATAFADTTLIAHAIGTATLGTVATGNGGVPDGLAVATAKSVAGTAAGTPFRLSRLAATHTFGDFAIKVPTA